MRPTSRIRAEQGADQLEERSLLSASSPYSSGDRSHAYGKGAFKGGFGGRRFGGRGGFGGRGKATVNINSGFGGFAGFGGGNRFGGGFRGPVFGGFTPAPSPTPTPTPTPTPAPTPTPSPTPSFGGPVFFREGGGEGGEGGGATFFNGFGGNGFGGNGTFFRDGGGEGGKMGGGAENFLKGYGGN